MRLFGFNITTRSTPPPDADFWYGEPQRTDLTKYLTDEGAFALSVVDACFSLIADSIGQLPMLVFRRRADGQRELVPTHPVYRRVHDAPCPFMTSSEFWARMVRDMLSRGDGFAELEWSMDASPRLLAMYPLKPEQMKVEWVPGREGRERVYVYRDTESSPERIIAAEDLLHLPGRGFDGLRGKSLIQLHRGVIELTAAAEEYGVRYFKQGATAPHYVSYPGQLSPDARNKAKEWLQSHFGGLVNAHKLGVLENGGEIKSIHLNHREMQFLELRKFQIEEVCRVCRIPPHMIASSDSAIKVGKSVEQDQIAFVQYTLGSYTRLIEQRCNEALFGPREKSRYFVEFDVDALIRGDMQAQAEYYRNAVGGAGWNTVNEVRNKKNLPPVSGGDVVFIQGAMLPLDKAGATIEANPNE